MKKLHESSLFAKPIKKLQFFFLRIYLQYKFTETCNFQHSVIISTHLPTQICSKTQINKLEIMNS